MSMNKGQMVQRLFSSILILSCLFVWSNSAQAQNVTDWLDDDDGDLIEEQPEEQQEAEPLDNDEPSFLWSLVKLVCILGLMIALLYVGVRFFSRRNRQMRDLNVLENLGGIPVGQQKSVQLIRLGSTYYLLGVGENVELLKEVKDESILQELQQLAEKPEEESFFAAFKGNHKQTDAPEKSNSFKQLYTKELDNLMNSRKELINSKQKRDEDNE